MLAIAMAAALNGEALQPWRLPESVTPSHYRISLDLDVEAERFSGEETIEVRIVSPTQRIVLNSLGLDISSAMLRQASVAHPLKVELDLEHERIILHAEEPLAAGDAAIDISFSGPLEEGLRGLYLSRSDEDVFAATQMQGTYARMMFPGFDEPAFKATFALDVEIDATATAISNGPLLSEELVDGGTRKIVRFGDSPKMSTYLVALAVGNYDCLSETIDEVPVRICGRPEKKHELQFAMDVTRKSLHFLNEWYGIHYPFGKLDMVAVPDYEWGGMENTAAIYYRESFLLVDPTTSSATRRQSVAGLVSHELAHMWFGDLVTPVWWDDIWLNEGFASWMAPKAVAAYNSEWQWEAAAVADAQWVMDMDSLPASRSILAHASTPDEIKEMFDGISYTKGAAIVRMLEAWVGEENFRRGVGAYLEKYANGNARSEDLWQAIGKVSGGNVESIMPGFVKQAGVPIVSFSTRQEGSGTIVSLGQERFLKHATKSSEQWKIPVCIRAGLADGSTSKVCELLPENGATIKVPAEVRWLIGNAGASGYYRVGFTDAQLRALIPVVPTLPPEERLSILSDAWAMAEAGHLGIGSYLDLLASYRGERDRFVLRTMSDSIADIRAALLDGEPNSGFDTWSASLYRELADELGMIPARGEDDTKRALRAKLVAILASAGDEAVLESLQETMVAYLEDPTSAEASLTEIAFNYVPAHGDSGMFDRLEEHLKETESGQTYDFVLTALTRFRDPALASSAIHLPESGIVRLDRYPSYYAELLRNNATREQAWSYLKANWPELQSKVVSFGGAGALRAIASFCEQALRDDVAHFFEQNEAPGAERALALSLEQADACIAFRETQAEGFREWLERL